MEDPTWEDLAKAEPRLERLLAEVRKADDGASRFCGVTAWHGCGGKPGLKMKAYRLTGFGAHEPSLRTMRAYEVATETLYGALPSCRGCACIEQEELEYA
jgi:hypothetical protein